MEGMKKVEDNKKNTIIEVVKKEMSIEEVTKSTTFFKKAYLWLILTSLLWIHYIGKINVFS